MVLTRTSPPQLSPRTSNPSTFPSRTPTPHPHSSQTRSQSRPSQPRHIVRAYLTKLNAPHCNNCPRKIALSTFSTPTPGPANRTDLTSDVYPSPAQCFFRRLSPLRFSRRCHRRVVDRCEDFGDLDLCGGGGVAARETGCRAVPRGCRVARTSLAQLGRVCAGLSRRFRLLRL